MGRARGEISRGRKLIYALVTVALILGGLELLARLVEGDEAPALQGVPPPHPVPRALHKAFMKRLSAIRKQHADGIVMVPDKARGWALPRGLDSLPYLKDEYSTNSLGLRGPAPAPKEKGEVRLFTLGDSSVFGAGVAYEHVFSTVAARELQRLLGRKATGIIGATPGYDSRQSLTTLRTVGPLVWPSWVVIGNLWSDLFPIGARDLRLRREAVLKGPLNRLALYRLAREWLPGLRPVQVRWLVSNKLLGGADGGKQARIPLKHYIQNLEQIIWESRGMGARVVMLILPARRAFSGDVYEYPNVGRYRQTLRDLAQEFKLPLVDGPAVFRAAGVGLDAFLDNVHPSAKGHYLLGKALADTLFAEMKRLDLLEP